MSSHPPSSDLPAPVSKSDQLLDTASEERGLAEATAPSAPALLTLVGSTNLALWAAVLAWTGELRRVVRGYQGPFVLAEILGVALGFVLAVQAQRGVDRWFLSRSRRIGALFLLPIAGLLLLIFTSGKHYSWVVRGGWVVFSCMQVVLALAYARLFVVGLGRFGEARFRRLLGFVVCGTWCGLVGWTGARTGIFSPAWSAPVALLGLPFSPLMGLLGLAVTGPADSEALAMLEAEDAGVPQALPESPRGRSGCVASPDHSQPW